MWRFAPLCCLHLARAILQKLAMAEEVEAEEVAVEAVFPGAALRQVVALVLGLHLGHRLEGLPVRGHHRKVQAVRVVIGVIIRLGDQGKVRVAREVAGETIHPLKKELARSSVPIAAMSFRSTAMVAMAAIGRNRRLNGSR